jgi:hypothetical protein
MYTLQWSETNEGFPEMESFDHLQHALVRLQQLVDGTSSSNFVADIYLDNQDYDGKLYSICEYNLQIGYNFEHEIVPY